MALPLTLPTLFFILSCSEFLQNTLTLQAFPSNVSSIVPRLDQMNTCVPGSRPNIVSGTLTLNLSEHRIVTIPVSLKYEDVEACLISMGTNFDAYSTEPSRSKSRRVKQTLETKIEGAHSPLTGPDFPKRDEQTAFNEKCPRPTWIHKLRTNHQDCVTLTPNQSGNGEPATSLATPVHCSSRCQTSSTVVNSRTHEEIQAARTILSLANSGELPAFLQHPNSLCCELDGTLHQFHGSKNSDSMETTDTQVVGPRQRSPIVDCSIGPTLFPLDSQSTPPRPASIVNCVQEQHHFNPASPVTGAELALNRNSNSRRCCSPGLDELSSPLTINPTDKTGQPTNPPILQPQANSSISTRLPRTHTSFRPPPKKRLSLHYQRNHTAAAGESTLR
ncbi:unnamed protein product [Dicrocoelium dendriticum]|nr:unnamed protein product [Dicrocoelium dendriticum]